MDLEPRIIKVSSEDALKSQVAELEKEKRRIIDCNDLEKGIVGKLAFFVPPEGKSLESGWGPQDADAVWVTWEKYGKELVCEKIQIHKGTGLFELYGEHRDHDIMGYTNALQKTAGFICFCKAHEGKSLLFFVHLNELKEVSPELLGFLEPMAQVVQPERK